MMTEYQRQKLDELIGWLTHYHCSNCDDLNEAINLAEQIRDCSEPREPRETPRVENIAEAFVMDMYSSHAQMEIIRSPDFKNPFVFSKSSGGSNFSQGITLNRFVELLGMRQAREEMPKEGEEKS